MTKKIIIADAGPLIAFARIKKLSLLVATIGKPLVPVTVFDECVSGVLRPGAIEIIKAVDKKVIIVHPDPDIQHYQALLEILGKGEAMAIALASQLKARLLIDDKQGRKVAEKMSVKIVGTAGVILHVKEIGLISAISPLTQALKLAGYHLSNELMKAVLKRAKEE